MSKQRLDRVLVGRAIGTRKEVQALCREGRVVVDGEIIDNPATKVFVDAEIYVDGEEWEMAPRIALYHKPVGVLSSMDDNWGREDLSDVLPFSWRAAMHPVGRLDADTSGLLLFSSDGQFTQRMLHPRHQIPRTYIATVEGQIDEESLRARLAAGIETSEGVFPANLLSVSGQDLEVEVQEGKYRMVRRILANAGHPVLALHRIRYGDFELGDLAPGQIIAADDDEP